MFEYEKGKTLKRFKEDYNITSFVTSKYEENKGKVNIFVKEMQSIYKDRVKNEIRKHNDINEDINFLQETDYIYRPVQENIISAYENETPVSEKKTPGQRKKNVLDWVEELVIAVVIIGVVFTFFFRIITVTGNSMAPNYSDGDRVLVTGAALGVEQGDVVVVVNVLEEPIIKRVIATEGQVVDFDLDTRAVLVDGQPVDETQFGLENGITDLPYSSFEVLEFPQTVPEGCVFVLGDNRSVSEDSRYQRVGMIDTRNILGKALVRIFPLDRIGLAQ